MPTLWVPETLLMDVSVCRRALCRSPHKRRRCRLWASRRAPPRREGPWCEWPVQSGCVYPSEFNLSQGTSEERPSGAPVLLGAVHKAGVPPGGLPGWSRDCAPGPGTRRAAPWGSDEGWPDRGSVGGAGQRAPVSALTCAHVCASRRCVCFNEAHPLKGNANTLFPRAGRRGGSSGFHVELRPPGVLPWGRPVSQARLAASLVPPTGCCPDPQL